MSLFMAAISRQGSLDGMVGAMHRLSVAYLFDSFGGSASLGYDCGAFMFQWRHDDFVDRAHDPYLNIRMSETVLQILGCGGGLPKSPALSHHYQSHYYTFWVQLDDVYYFHSPSPLLFFYDDEARSWKFFKVYLFPINSSAWHQFADGLLQMDGAGGAGLRTWFDASTMTLRFGKATSMVFNRRYLTLQVGFSIYALCAVPLVQSLGRWVYWGVCDSPFQPPKDDSVDVYYIADTLSYLLGVDDL